MAQLRGAADAEIEATLEDVWRAVEDVLAAPAWQGGVVGMKPLERDGEGRVTLVEVENDIKVRHVKTRVRFQYEPPTQLSWTQEKGDLRSVTGSWRLEELNPHCTRATYRLDVDPGRVLGLVLRGPVEDAVRSALVNARPGELKAHVENR